jgi:hypothetical protein
MSSTFQIQLNRSDGGQDGLRGSYKSLEIPKIRAKDLQKVR